MKQWMDVLHQKLVKGSDEVRLTIMDYAIKITGISARSVLQ